MSYKEVREPGTGKLLFKFDAERDRIHLIDHRRKIDTEIDLVELRERLDRDDSDIRRAKHRNSK